MAEDLNTRLRESAMRRRIAENDLAARRLASVQARYDAVNPADGKRRRQSEVDVQEETGSLSRQLTPHNRLLLIAMARDLRRNFSATRSIVRQLRLNVIGWQHKLYLNKDLGTEEAQNWFNRKFARNCSFRDDSHISELWGLALDSVIGDGDCGQYFDADLAQTGRLIFYEADQLCDLAAADLPKVGAALSQDGVLRDGWGREIGYVVNKVKRGATACQLVDAMVFRRDPLDESQNHFKLLRMPWRHNQGRGVSELAPVINDMMDCYDMRARELQSAKLAAALGMKVKRAASPAAAVPPSFLPGTTETDTEAAEAEEEEQSNYERFEHLTGGYIEYLDDGDDVEALNFDRPNVNAVAFLDKVISSAGSALGMAEAYALLRAQGSYTQFRGDIILTWVLFEYWQKWAERHMKDWTAVRAIRYAIERGLVKEPQEGWEDQMQWAHPRRPEVDPVKEQGGITAAMKNGLIDPSDIIGPDWQDKSESLFRFFDLWRERGYTAAAMETKSGGVAAPAGAGQDDNDGNDGKNGEQK
jgi:hypothetical protein